MKDNTEAKQKIWATLDKLRATNSVQIDSRLLELIAEIKGLEKLDSILTDNKVLESLSRLHDGFVPPIYILKFINELAQTVNPKTHLDPWLTISSPCNFYDFGNTTAYCINQTTSEIIKSLLSNEKTVIQLGDGSLLLDNLKLYECRE